VVLPAATSTAGWFAPSDGRLIGCEVIPLITNLDYTFPEIQSEPRRHGNAATRSATRCLTHKADVGLGFDGDGGPLRRGRHPARRGFRRQRSALMLARGTCRRSFRTTQSWSTFEIDRPVRHRSVAEKQGAQVTYLEDGHSYMKRRTNELGALAGFEKYRPFLSSTIRSAGVRRRLLVGHRGREMLRPRAGRSMADLERNALPKTLVVGRPCRRIARTRRNTGIRRFPW